MSKLLLLIGLPGSGKSTLAKRCVHRRVAHCVVSTDAIRQQLFGDEAVQSGWLHVQAEVERQLRSAMGLFVIYDATNVVRRYRRQAIALVHQVGFSELYGLWLDTPLDLCLERNRNRGRVVPDDVIETMWRSLQGAPPSLCEGFDGLARICLNDRYDSER